MCFHLTNLATWAVVSHCPGAQVQMSPKVLIYPRDVSLAYSSGKINNEMEKKICQLQKFLFEMQPYTAMK